MVKSAPNQDLILLLTFKYQFQCNVYRVLVFCWFLCPLIGANFLCWFGTEAYFIVSEPELVKEILNNRDNIYSKGHIQLHMKKLLGDGLVASEGEKWSKMRKLANFAFHADRLRVRFFS